MQSMFTHPHTFNIYRVQSFIRILKIFAKKRDLDILNVVNRKKKSTVLYIHINAITLWDFVGHFHIALYSIPAIRVRSDLVYIPLSILKVDIGLTCSIYGTTLCDSHDNTRLGTIAKIFEKWIWFGRLCVHCMSLSLIDFNRLSNYFKWHLRYRYWHLHYQLCVCFPFAPIVKKLQNEKSITIG